ncbi:probable thimet oligopeptidase isoform X2 [Diospyros lotus]|uniref:probable thimet oligopeptidase isoform X2 n=1 Tax=Diospyros lotus TaxID=55363 RepID=UPI002257D95B|nr:probable thimet oligopeptidase isoform X2 [Diospyros lotus]
MASKQKKDRKSNLLVVTGAAAFLAVAIKFAIDAVAAHHKNCKRRKDIPGSAVRANLSAAEILRLADRIIAKSKQVHDAVASVPLDKVTYANTILPLAELEAWQFPLVQSCVFPKLVSTFEDVRKASAETERRIDAHVSTCRKQEDVYRPIKAFAARGEWMNFESKRYTQCLSLDKAENGKFKVSLRGHHVSPVLEFCKVGLTRRRVAVAYGRRCEGNLSILESLVELRHKFARLLGYTNYADYAIGNRMASSSTKVFEFLEDLSASLSDLATRELNVLKDYKKKEEGDSPFGIEDLLYYVKRIEEQQLNLHFGDLKQYLPVSLVISGILKICQDLFGLRFDEIVDAEVWHSDVHLYSVHDLSSGELLGYFYLDMFSREGKYGHTCVVALQNGSFVNGVRKIPVALLISQLQKEVGGHTRLLRFSEVVNLFHEFGHVVHHICNRASFARFSGLRLDPDFVEIPAQLLENWCYESAPLKLISGFHQDITKPIKDETCEALKRWRCSFSALKLKQEILYCLFDLIIHSTENVDMVGLFKHLHPKVMLGLPMLEGTNPASCFHRTAIGYEAACYSRIWSEVFAADVFVSKFRDDLSNQFVGMQFRNKVLSPGGAKDPVELLSDFLGREPSVQAFIDSKLEYGL